MAQPPELMEELVGEILRALPPDEPACLFRASAVSKSWRSLLTNPTVLRRYREYHGAPPVLGFLQNTHLLDDLSPRFVPTTAASPFSPPSFPCKHWIAVDCRHGRVLVHTVYPTGLLVWNPVTGDQKRLPDEPGMPYNHFSGAVLCAAEGCDHLDCRGGPFRVVFAATASEDVGDELTWASMYSSQTGEWTAPTMVQHGAVMPRGENVVGPSLLTGEAVYFVLDLQDRRHILRYDLGEDTMSIMDLPPLGGRNNFLVAAEDRGLGIVTVEGYSLQLWSSRADENGVMGWARGRAVQLDPIILPFTIGDPTTTLRVVGFAEGPNVIFVTVNDGTYTIELKSGRIKKVSKTTKFDTVVPCVTFYTLALEAATPTDEGPGAGALGA